MKFELHNLHFDGSSVPSSPKAVKDAVSDYVNTCIAKGFKIPNTPTKAVLFTTLIEDLTRLGLLGETTEESVDQDQQDPLLEGATGHLSADHRKHVIILSEIRIILKQHSIKGI